MARLRSALLVFGFFTAGVSAICPADAHAHSNMPPPIQFWGPFNSGTVRCQRTISEAGQRCFERAVMLQQQCMAAELAGQTCDESARDASIQNAARSAQQVVATSCSSIELQQLGFVSLDEAKSDVGRACGDQSDAAVSVMFAPVLERGGVVAGDAGMSQCIAQVSSFGRKLVRVVSRLRSSALDRIAAHNPPVSQRLALLAQADQRVATVRQKIATLIHTACPSFDSMYDRNMTSFLDALEPRSNCLVSYGYVQSAVTCPVPVCGNGVKETGEQCDDGNTTDDDICHNNCTKNDCAAFPSTFALVQAAIFDGHGCTNDLCHGSSRQGGLDLRAGAAYSSLVGAGSEIAPNLKRVEPGDEQRSLLWLKLAAATLGTTGVPGSAMPQGLAPLSSNELEAVRLWIHATAPETGNVLGVAPLLDACAVPSDPIQIEAPAAPPTGTGVQLHMPKWQLPANSEHEVCFVSRYDFTAQVPEDYRGPDDSFLFHRQIIVQDPQSHHLIVNLYTGTTSIDDPVWGPFTCKGGSHDGVACDPNDLVFCGTDGICGSEPTSSVACIGFGPADSQLGGFNGFTGTQQTAYEQTLASGVYEQIPLKGTIIWNSHAFNLTRQSAKQEAWINFYFAAKADQQYPVKGIFDANHIFDMHVPPFQTEEVCADHPPLEQGAQLFQLSSHNHKRGKRFTIFAPDGRLLFTSTVYNDPLQLVFNPPMVFDDPDPAMRTLHFCSLYDNGATTPTEVKRNATSPPTPNGFPFGGPCNTAANPPSGCTQGKIGQSCSGNTQRRRDTSCDSTPGKGDGLCDACTLRGGVTTEDEMFILLGLYYVK